MRKLFFIPFIIFILSGCTGLPSQFQCHVPAGGLCASMGQVDHLVTTKQLPGLTTSQSAVTYIRVEEPQS